jgi:hypothetical protein
VAGHVGSLAGAERGFCPHCFSNLWQGARCKRRTCPGYAPIYLRDHAERLKAALAEWEGETTIATLTAPGARVLPWDPRRCKARGPHAHSGPAGCEVDRWAAADWNRTATKRLSALIHAASERVRRANVGSPHVLATVLELKRGVFHAHIVLGYEGFTRKALDVFLDALDDLRGEYGFGTSKRGGFDRGHPGRFSGPHAGLYTSKYLRPDGAKGSFIPALIRMEQLIKRYPETGRPVEQIRPVFVSPKLTRRSGVTMRFLRWSRRAYYVYGVRTRAEALFVWRLVELFGLEARPVREWEVAQLPVENPDPPPIPLEPLRLFVPAAPSAIG